MLSSREVGNLIIRIQRLAILRNLMSITDKDEQV